MNFEKSFSGLKQKFLTEEGWDIVLLVLLPYWPLVRKMRMSIKREHDQNGHSAFEAEAAAILFDSFP